MSAIDRVFGEEDKSLRGRVMRLAGGAVRLGNQLWLAAMSRTAQGRATGNVVEQIARAISEWDRTARHGITLPDGATLILTRWHTDYPQVPWGPTGSPFAEVTGAKRLLMLMLLDRFRHPRMGGVVTRLQRQKRRWTVTIVNIEP